MSQRSGVVGDDTGSSSSLPPPNTAAEAKSAPTEKKSRLVRNLRLNPAGESGRRGFHPWHFSKITFKSSNRASTLCNLLWPFVPAAIAVRYALPNHHVLAFALAYVAMVPCANMVGFAGQELAKKLPHVLGVMTEVLLGATVEMIMFIVLLSKDEFYVIKAAILGSILATLLLCLGACFFIGGLKRTEQSFSETVSETGHGLLLLAGVTMAVPTVFSTGLSSYGLTAEDVADRSLNISRILSILLLISQFIFTYFQAHTHHGLYEDIFEDDEERHTDKHEEMRRAKLTLTETLLSLVVSIALTTLIATTLVLQIPHVVEASNVSDPFIGLILVPLVEKFAEHLTAIDEAYDDQMNFAMSHVLGATLATALFNAPIVVIVGWGLGKAMDLSFEIFNLAMLILSIITVGRFLQDQKSNYLEGFLMIILYIAIAVAAWYYPNPHHE